ncbi:SCO family protein [Alkalilimnicola sp. S0819]|uniref:SCO family protein n=1 Tax=Alkalilimnicola sp. S0819 TaxID=2613922 RepID=UPI001261CB99|nr:SCO family protein [Alkalilimnicola sp. S0819]KAB7627840.1 SCO family protein [Alkalilimnicola sp. S0819]MPQ15473.1 redoxin domain-containing protein [Alkalilimnicola sp. S0819]
MNMQGKSSLSLVLGILALGLLALLTGLWTGGALRGGPSGSPAGLDATYIPGGKPIADFRLVDHHGKPYTPERLRGQWTLIFFGYTYCPDICPTTLLELGGAWPQWQAEGLTEDTQVVFVSVDPARDTPERLAEYVPYFHPDFLGVTGPDAQLEPFTRSMGILYVRHEPKTGNDAYLVDHSSAVLLINPQGQLQALFGGPHKADTLARDYRLIREHHGH